MENNQTTTLDNTTDAPALKTYLFDVRVFRGDGLLFDAPQVPVQTDGRSDMDLLKKTAQQVAYKLKGKKFVPADKVEITEVVQCVTCQGSTPADSDGLECEDCIATAKALEAEAADEHAEATKRKTRYGAYDATQKGLLTPANGFIRDGWKGSTVVTKKELLILDEIVDMLIDQQDGEDGGDWGFSNIDANDVAEAAGMTVNQVNGAMSVLVAKEFCVIDPVKSKEGGKTRTTRYIRLTPTGYAAYQAAKKADADKAKAGK